MRLPLHYEPAYAMGAMLSNRWRVFDAGGLEVCTVLAEIDARLLVNLVNLTTQEQRDAALYATVGRQMAAAE